MITIFKPQDLEYPDAGLSKPVRYTVKDLENVAKKTSTINITNEHSKEVLGVLSNFVVEDGVLKADAPEGFDLNGMGLSPVFDTELVDMGDYYSISSISMGEIGLTKNPRSNILYNNITSTSTEVNMGESALEKVIREKDELQKRIGVLESTEKQYKRIIKQQEEEIEKIKESDSDKDNLIKENKALKEKADAFDVMNKARKEELIQDIVGDDDKLAKEYEELSIPTLELIKRTMKVSSPQKGVTPTDTHVDNGDDPVGEQNEEEEYTDEMFEADFAASGL
jgi:hypothetical protein